MAICERSGSSPRLQRASPEHAGDCGKIPPDASQRVQQFRIRCKVLSLGPKRRSEEQPGSTPRSTACSVVRRIDSMTASQVTHDAIVDLGFEGSVLKRGRSIYRGGRTLHVKVKLGEAPQQL